MTFRRADDADLAAVVALLADDDLGAEREGSDLAPYREAFAEIDADPRHLLLVGDLGGEVVACLQLTVLPCLTHGGRRRSQVEGVRVRGDQRGAGVGRQLLRHAIAWSIEQGCGVVQLTTDKRRPEALRFYEQLGFVATHEGLKLPLPSAPG
ncbi:N-acetyltransferase family protein [Aquihabitans sp. G128]|uniref:GNAT family N-acetyltransferase n=1 Tax=Aquihabitans sp. G128 TaxID=2849779 RepID=UPI00352D43A5